MSESKQDAATPGQARPTACDVDVWDGPYRMNCGLTLVEDRCIRHGDSTMRRWRAEQDATAAAGPVSAATPGQAERNLSNVQFVGRNGLGEVSVAMPRARMTRDEALVHAAWLILIAGGELEIGGILAAIGGAR